MKRAVVCLFAVLSSVPVSAQWEAVPEDANQSSPAPEAAKASGSLRFAYIGAGWTKVLEDIAEAGGYELVLANVPQGRFERYDVKPVPVEQAIAIVNESLAAQSVRVVTRGKYLLVLTDETFRPTYPRFHYGSANSGSANTGSANSGPANAAPIGNVPNSVATLQPTANQTTQHFSEAPAIVHANAIQPNVEARRMPANAPLQRIQQTSFDNAANLDRVEPVISQLNPQAMAALANASSTRQATVMKPRRLQASAIAKTVYEAFGDTAQLVDDGPLGLPAFKVSTVSADKQPIGWSVGVDIDADRLVIDAPDAVSNSLVQLFQRIDRQDDRQPIVLAKAAPHIHSAAVGLTPIVQTMLAMQDGEAPNENTPRGPQQPAGGEEDITRILDRLRSNVTVESLDELGLLILRGNEGDVDAVMQIIDAIEKQSVGTTPEVHLRVLANVDSSAMADLLNGVYEAVQSIETRPGRDDKRVSVTSVVRPNAVMIVAPSVELPSILDLIDNLDKPVDPTTELRVYRLKFATASTAVATINEFYEERGGLGTRVRASADARTNSVIVQARPNDLAEVDTLLFKLDRVDGGSVSRMQLFPLKNAVATELADFLTAAIEDVIQPLQTGGGRVGQNAQENRSVVLEFFQSGEAAAELLRSGVLEDVRVSADPRTNSVAVIAPERSMPLFAALIESLDTPSAAANEVKVFTLSNADASAAAELLGELFEESGTEAPVGVQLSGANDSASNLLPVKFSVDVRTNSIVATGGPDALTVVEAILLRLDSSDSRGRTTQVLKLKNSYAPDVADAINQFLESQRELSAANPDLVSTVELLNREVIVVPELASNNLLISATEEYYADILRIATELDAPQAQVIVQAMLVEVTLDNADEFGVELGFQDSVLFDRSLQTNTAVTTAGNQTVLTPVAEPGFRFGDLQTFPNLGNAVASPGTVGGQSLSNFALGRVSELGFGGLVLSASSEAVSTLIRALAVNREVNVLSRPQIRTVDGQLAQIQVGQEVPIINGVTIAGTGVATPIIEYDEAGLILEVTPRISPDGQIVMEVIAERSAYDLNNGVPVFTDVATGTTISSPIKDITVARSTVSITNGQTVVLGGLITQRDESITRKVPWLGDIPLVGRAFRYDQRSNLRTELLIFLTPRVISNDIDNAVIKEVEAGRLHWLREEAEAMHGPIFDVEQPIYEPGMVPPEMLPPAVEGIYELRPNGQTDYQTEIISPAQVNQFTPTPVPAEVIQ